MSDKQYFTMIQVRNALNQIAERMAEDNSNRRYYGNQQRWLYSGVYPSRKLGIPMKCWM